jgi:hypothetical protein
MAGLTPIQAAWPLNRPLDSLRGRELQTAIDQISDKLIRSVLIPVADLTKMELRASLDAALGSNIVAYEELAVGDFSIMYRARRAGREVVVKVALPSIKYEWIADDFNAQAKWFRENGETPFIKVLDEIDVRHEKQRVSCAIMEYIGWKTLKDIITPGKGISPLIVCRSPDQLQEDCKMPNSIFLSYSRKDRDWCERFAKTDGIIATALHEGKGQRISRKGLPRAHCGQLAPLDAIADGRVRRGCSRRCCDTRFRPTVQVSARHVADRYSNGSRGTEPTDSVPEPNLSRHWQGWKITCGAN